MMSTKLEKDDLIIQMLKNQQEILNYLLRASERHDHQFEKLEERFEKIEQRFEKVDDKFERIDEKFEQVFGLLEAIKNQNVTWNVGVIGGIIAVSTIINFLITRLMLSGVKLIDIFTFWVS